MKFYMIGCNLGSIYTYLHIVIIYIILQQMDSSKMFVTDFVVKEKVNGVWLKGHILWQN